MSWVLYLIMHWLVYCILSGICACGCIHKCNDSLSIAICAYYDIYFQQGKGKALHSNTYRLNATLPVNIVTIKFLIDLSKS